MQQVNDLLDLLLGEESLEVIAELLFDLGNGLCSPPAMSQRVMDLDPFGGRSVLEMDLDGICNAALGRVEVILGIGLLFSSERKE